MNSLTQTVDLPDQEPVAIRKGPLTLFVRKLINEIWVASLQDAHIAGAPAPLPDEPEWQRVALPREYDRLSLTPVLPDRAVVVDTDYAYRVLPGTRSRVYCRIPVSIRIASESDPSVVIAELPTVTLSSTWFGPFTEGELCYALSSKIRRVLDSSLNEPHLLFCPIEIINKSTTELQFEKVCLRTERLSIYQAAEAMWADETRIVWHGSDHDTDVSTHKGIPAEAGGHAKVLCSARDKDDDRISVRSFKLLRDFSLPGF